MAVRLTQRLRRPISAQSVERGARRRGVLNEDGTIDQRYETEMATTNERSYGSRWFPPNAERNPAA
jgi:hypothetical protein